MLIVVVRHAHAAHNVTGNTNLLDPPLTDTGLEQCKAKQGTIDCDLVISSSAQRALQTAHALFTTNIKIYATDLLLEYQTGVRCNMREELEVQKKRFPTVDFDTYAIDEEPLPVETTWLDGQCRAKRIFAMLQKIHADDQEAGLSRQQQRTVCLVGHANILRNLLHETTGGDSITLENCGQFVFEIKD